MKKVLSVLVALVLLALMLPASSVLAQSTDEGFTASSGAGEIVIQRGPQCPLCGGAVVYFYGPWTYYGSHGLKRIHFGTEEKYIDRARDWTRQCENREWCSYRLSSGIEIEDGWDCNH